MNQHYEFWVHYYENLAVSDQAFSSAINANNEHLANQKWGHGVQEILPACQHRILLQVAYPGIVVGLGYAHGSGRAVPINDKVPPEIKLGITLDNVTGLPYIPGSSVKGVLRSAFMTSRGYVQVLLSEIGVNISEKQVEELELDIFGHQHAYHAYESTVDAGQGHDTFLDAYPVDADRNDHLLGIENITPHRANDVSLDGLAEPNPLTLLKVMPGVVFLFRFQLVDTVLSEGATISAAQKESLFRQLLLDQGIGAKTNVGFGMLIEPTGWEARDTYTYLEAGGLTSARGRHVVALQPQHVVRAQAPTRDTERLTSVAQIKVGKKVKGTLVNHHPVHGWFIEVVPGPRRGRRGINGLLREQEIPRGIALNAGQEVVVEIVNFKGEKRIGLRLITDDDA